MEKRWGVVLRITYGQMTSLVMLTIIVQLYSYAPSVMAEYAEHHLWISILIAIVLSTALGWSMFKLSLHFPDDSFLEVLKKITGKYLGSLIGVSYCIYFFILFIIHTQILVTTFKTLFLPTTPTSAILLLVLVFAFYSAYLEIEVLARASNALLILLIATLTFLFLAVIPEIDVGNYQPFMPGNMAGIWHATLIPFAVFGQVIIVSAILPFVNKKNEKPKTKGFMVGIIFTFLISGLIVVEEIGVFSSYELERLQFPSVELITLIQMGEFLERLEIFLVTLWAGSMFLVLGIFFTVSLLLLKQMRKKKNKGLGINLVFNIIAFIICLRYLPDTASIVDFLFEKWIYLSLIFQTAIPILLIGVFLVRKKVITHAKN